MSSQSGYFLEKLQQYIRTNKMNLKLRVYMQNKGNERVISDKVQRGITRFSCDLIFFF